MFSKTDLVRLIQKALEASNLERGPLNLEIGKPDLFLVTYLADEYTRIDPESTGLVQAIFRNVGRKALRLNVTAAPRYISRITFENRLSLPHNDILEIMKVVSGETRQPPPDNLGKIEFEPLITEYQRYSFLIHDQCISDGTTTLNLFDILKPFNIRLIGTDLAMHYYCLTQEFGKNEIGFGTTKRDDHLKTTSNGAGWAEKNLYKEGAIFDYSGDLKQIKHNGGLILYHPVSRKAKTLKKIASNLIKKIRHKRLMRSYKGLFMEMKPLLTETTDTVTLNGYKLYRKNFLNPQFHYYPQIIFKEHDITKPFAEPSSIMLVFNALKIGYFGQEEIEAVIPTLLAGLNDGGLLFVGEGEFNDISYTVFQRNGRRFRFVYKVGKGTSVEDTILRYGQ